VFAPLELRAPFGRFLFCFFVTIYQASPPRINPDQGAWCVTLKQKKPHRGCRKKRKTLFSLSCSLSSLPNAPNDISQLPFSLSLYLALSLGKISYALSLSEWAAAEVVGVAARACISAQRNFHPHPLPRLMFLYPFSASNAPLYRGLDGTSCHLSLFSCVVYVAVLFLLYR
jgi:hypothetical protein